MDDSPNLQLSITLKGACPPFLLKATTGSSFAEALAVFLCQFRLLSFHQRFRQKSLSLLSVMAFANILFFASRLFLVLNPEINFGNLPKPGFLNKREKKHFLPIFASSGYLAA